MTKTVNYYGIATTDDTGDPVLRVQTGDSHMEVILDTEDNYLNVWYVHSAEKGDMKLMMDHLVEQLPITKVRFISPLDEDDVDIMNVALGKLHMPHTPVPSEGQEAPKIHEVVHGFEEKKVNFGGKKATVLEGEWQVGEYKE